MDSLTVNERSGELCRKIKDEKEFRDYQEKLEAIIANGTQLGNMELLSKEDLDEMDRLVEVLEEYEAEHYPLPGESSTIFSC